MGGKRTDTIGPASREEEAGSWVLWGILNQWTVTCHWIRRDCILMPYLSSQRERERNIVRVLQLPVSGAVLTLKKFCYSFSFLSLSPGCVTKRRATESHSVLC